MNLYTLVDFWFLIINLIWYTFCLCIYRVFVKNDKNKFGLRAIKMNLLDIFFTLLGGGEVSKFDFVDFNGPETKFIFDSLYKHPVKMLQLLLQ